MKQIKFLFLLVVSLLVFSCTPDEVAPNVCLNGDCGAEFWVDTLGPVSYTHLTLPTIYSV